MSGIDQLTTDYLSKESSIKTPTTLDDGVFHDDPTPETADVGMNSSRNGVISAGEHHHLSHATTAGPAHSITDGVSAEERFFEVDFSNASAGHAAERPIVDRRDVSVEDISHMRREGCRTHCLTPEVSYSGGRCDTVQGPTSSGTALRRVSDTSSRHADGQDGGADNASATSFVLIRSLQLRPCATSPDTNALDTSVAILQRMATDTAARVEAAVARSGHTPGELPSIEAPSSASPPSTVSTRQRTAVPAAPTEKYAGREDTTDVIGFNIDGDSERPTSQLHTGSTRPFFHSSASSNSPLHSLSESELYGTQVHPLGASRNISTQALSQLGADQRDDAVRTLSGSVPRLDESPNGTRRRLRLMGAAPHPPREVRSNSAPTGSLSTPPMQLGAAASPLIDASVYNHDFQRIISHEVKEALTRNMRPSVDDDEDEDEALLNDVLSGRASPALLPMQKRESTHLSESRNCTFAPFQLPMGTTSISRLDSVVGVSSLAPGAGATSGFADRTLGRRPLSLSTADLDEDVGEGRGATTHASSRATTYASSTRGGAAPETQITRAISAQAWRFPTLGNDPSGSFPAVRRVSLDGARAAAETAKRDNTTERNVTGTDTTPTGGGAASSSRRTHRTGLPNSCYDSSSGRQLEQVSPLAGSWRQRRGSGGGVACTVAARSLLSHGRDAAAGGGVGATADGTFLIGVAGVKEASAPLSTATGDVGAAPFPCGSVSGGGEGLSSAAGAVRFEDGRLYAQPLVSTHFSSSLPGSGGLRDDSYLRKLEMLYAVYERLSQERRSGSGQPSRVVRKLIAARKSTQGASESFPVAPQAGQVGQQRSPGHAAVTNAARGSGLSSHERRSPSLSCSGALGRSAGYYSFGMRVSLSHPNRQALPQQYLGSCSSLLHGTPSPRTSVLGSPAVVDLVVGGSSIHCGGTTVATAVNVGVEGGNNNNSSAPESSLTHVTSSATRMARRSLNSTLVRRIESRPLLQSTLFLKHTLRTICEAHCDADKHMLVSETSKDSNTASQLALSGATAVPSAPHDVAKFTDSAAAVDTAAAVSGHECLVSMATPLGSAANVTSDDAELSSGRHTRGLSSASSRASLVDKAVAAHRRGTASPGVDDGARQETAATSGRPSHVDPNDGSTTFTEAPSLQPPPQEEQTYAPQPSNDTGSGTTQQQQQQQQQRYYRALTEAEKRVRHVHGVDGVEREVDNEALDLIVYVGMRLMGWLEVVSLLGCGSFGQVFLCKDLRICDGHFVHPGEIGGVDYEYWNCSHAFLPFSSVDIPPTNPPLVAVKVVKSVPLLEQQSVLEAEMLVLIGAQTAPAAQTPATALEDCNAPPPEDPRCAYVAKVLADGICYGHHCIVMERYGANLYEYIASNEHLGLPMYQIRSIGYQLFTALSLIHEECHIIHADIKPENMLLTLNSSRGVVRTNETSAPAPAGATAAPSPEGVTLPPPTSPPRNVQRAEEVAAAATSTTCSLERSYITLRTGPTAAGRHRHSRRSSGVPLDASTSTLGRSKGQSFCHLRSSMTSRLTVVEQTNVPAPEPRRVQSLNQSAGMLPSRNVFSAQVDAPSFSSLAAAGGGKSAPAAAPSSLSSMAPRLHVKLIDFSSSCYDGGPFYQYIQSRYYRAPEVIVGASYGSGIDIWSSGCLLAELLLGMPLLPGCNDHHQLCLIEEMVGPLPTSMVQEGVNTELYYKHAEPAEEVHEAAAQSPTPPPRPFALRSREEFLLITQSEPQPYRRYFTYQTLQELVRHCPLTLQERRMSNGLQPYVPANESAEIPPNTTPSPSVRSEMMKQRFLLFDLLRRLLQTDPTQRPTASRVLTHPFFTSAPPYMKTFMLE